MAPRGTGRLAVRFITASMSASYHMLRAPAAPAPTAIASSATKREPGMDGARCGDDAHEGGEDDERHHPRLQQREVIARRALAAFVPGGLGLAKLVSMSLISVRYLITGSVLNWWNGGGEDSVHSSVVAPAPHGLSPAGSLRA